MSPHAENVVPFGGAGEDFLPNATSPRGSHASMRSPSSSETESVEPQERNGEPSHESVERGTNGLDMVGLCWFCSLLFMSGCCCVSLPTC